MDVTQSDVTQLLQQLDDLLQQVDHLASSLPQQETERACYLQVVFVNTQISQVVVRIHGLCAHHTGGGGCQAARQCCHPTGHNNVSSRRGGTTCSSTCSKSCSTTHHHPLCIQLQQLKRVLEATTQAKLAAEQRSADILHKREEALQKTLRDVERLENQDAVHKQELSTLSTQVQRLEHMLQQQQRNTDSMEQLQHMLDTALKEQQQNGVNVLGCGISYASIAHVCVQTITATEIATRLESFSVAATVFQGGCC